jgi:hypothetical protein
MPDIDEPLPLPTNPQTVADLLPHLPVPYDYGRQYGMVFGQELADRLASAGREPNAARCIACADDRRPIPSVCRPTVSGAQRTVRTKLHPLGCQPV